MNQTRKIQKTITPTDFIEYGFQCVDSKNGIDGEYDENGGIINERKVLNKFYLLQLDESTDLEVLETVYNGNSTINVTLMINTIDAIVEKYLPHIKTRMQVKQLVRSMTGRSTVWFVALRDGK